MGESWDASEVQGVIDAFYATVFDPGEKLRYQTPAAVWYGEPQDWDEFGADKHGLAFVTNRRLAFLHCIPDGTQPCDQSEVRKIAQLDAVALGSIGGISTTPFGLIFQLLNSGEFRIAMIDPLLSIRLEREVIHARGEFRLGRHGET